MCLDLHKKKSRIRETKNLSTDADSRTTTILERLRDMFFFDGLRDLIQFFFSFSHFKLLNKQCSIVQYSAADTVLISNSNNNPSLIFITTRIVA